MTHDEIIEVVAAHTEGKKIEQLCKRENNNWCNCVPDWDFAHFNYRVAREPRKCWIRWNDSTGRPELFSAHELPSTEGWQLVTEQL